MYANSLANNSKTRLWKRPVDKHSSHHSHSPSNISNDEISVATVSKINIFNIHDHFSDDVHKHTHDHSEHHVFEENINNSGQGEGGMERQMRRHFFEANLVKAGLELEEDAHKRQETESSPSRMTVFVKVHAPWSVLCRQAEALKMRMPLQLQDAFAGQLDAEQAPFWKFRRRIKKLCQIISRCFHKKNDDNDLSSSQHSKISQGGHRKSIWGIPFGARKNPDAGENKHVTWPFQRKRINKFLLNDVETFFTPTQRMEIVWEILQRSRNDPNDEKKRGIELLLGLKLYESAFPLHDGQDVSTSGKSDELLCDRQRLKKTWASWRCTFTTQPIELIRSYFGEKVAFYFSFLSFYTKMLALPAVFGVGAFIYGFVYAEDDDVVRSVCDKDNDPGRRMMCPICKLPNCEFFPMSDGCWNAVWEYRIDNEATLVLACFTVVWATVFLKLWKRHEAELAFEWDTYDIELEDLVVRPEYEEKATTRRANSITREIEPYVPASTRACGIVLSACVTALMLCGVGATLGGLVFARIQLYGELKRANFEKPIELARWIVHALTFIVVTIFEFVYNFIAAKTTSMECPRTQSKWLWSYLWKVFVFQVLNDFVPIGYAAWIKGNTAHASKLSWSTELCEIGGCMSEATELIAVLLLCRLVIGNSIEIGIPFISRLWSKFLDRKEHEKDAQDGQRSDTDSQWHQDMLLDTLHQDGVAKEYMEMVIQFAFCTLFVPAFPAAPFVCLLNNILEIRVDAINFVSAHKRPLPIRVPGIQIWNSFLDIVAKLAILCNAGLISFTSELVPRFYYKYQLSEDGSLDGYPIFTLSFLKKEKFSVEDHEYFEASNLTGCWYEDRLNDTVRSFSESTSKEEEEEDQMWWEVMTMRIVAFALFTISSFTFQWLFNFLVPDTPTRVTTKIQRRRYVVTKAMETEVVYDRWLKHAMNTSNAKRPRTHEDAINRDGPNEKIRKSHKTAMNGGTLMEAEEEHSLEPMTKEAMRVAFPFKRR